MNKVREIRKMRGLTQIQLSEKANISQAYLCDLEKNRRGAKPDTFQRIADALDVSVNELVDQEVV